MPEAVPSAGTLAGAVVRRVDPIRFRIARPAPLYVVLYWVFADGLFALKADGLFAQMNPKDGILIVSEGTIWTYVLLAVIIAVGVYQARRLPPDGVTLRSTVDEATPGHRWLLPAIGTPWARGRVAERGSPLVRAVPRVESV